MSTRAVLAVGLAVAVLLASVGPVAGIAGTPTDRADGATVHRTEDTLAQYRASGDASEYRVSGNASEYRASGDASAQYKVSLDNVTIRTWLLRNSTVLNATIQQVVVRNVTTPDGGRANVRLSNVTVGTFVLQRAKLTNVTASELIVRNKSVLSIPGGEFIDPQVKNRTIERHWTQNATVTGVVIDRLTLDAAVLCGNTSLGQRANDTAAIDPRKDGDKPAVTVKNGSVGEALMIRGRATNWSVGSVNQSRSTDATLPKACNRG